MRARSACDHSLIASPFLEFPQTGLSLRPPRHTSGSFHLGPLPPPQSPKSTRTRLERRIKEVKDIITKDEQTKRDETRLTLDLSAIEVHAETDRVHIYSERAYALTR